MGVSLIFFAAKYFRDYRDLRRLYLIWFGVFCVLVLLGFWELLTGHHLPVSGYYEAKLAVLEPYVRAAVMYRPTGVFNNPNDYATFLALSIPFGLSLARYHRKLWLRAFGMATVLLGGYLILATGSRGNLLAVLLELGFLWFFLVRGAQRLKLAVAVAAVVGVVLVITPTPARVILQGAREQFASILYEMPLESGSIYVRRNLFKNGLLFVYRTAGFGVGAGNAEHWMANFARYNTFGNLNPHNWWVELLVDYGVFIFAGYLLLYLSIVRRLWRIHKHTTGAWRIICEALLLSLVGFSIASVSPSSIMAFTPNWMLFAFALAFLNYSFCHGPLATSQFTREVNRE
jgi:teichuronic acid biosynthesis protein TuaE